MDATKTIELAAPIEFADQKYETISLREPTCGEMDKAFTGKEGMAASILLISLVSGIPRGAIEKLPMRVFSEAADFLSGFTATSPTISDS